MNDKIVTLVYVVWNRLIYLQMFFFNFLMFPAIPVRTHRFYEVICACVYFGQSVLVQKLVSRLVYISLFGVFFFFFCLNVSVLEVLQFGRDAYVAESWLAGQEPLVRAADLGTNVDEVESLIKRHEAFEKLAAAWEERFVQLEKLTTVS